MHCYLPWHFKVPMANSLEEVEALEVDLVALDVVPTFQLSATNAINQKQEKEPSFVFVS